MDPFAEEVVDAINAISGKHPGHRAAHAKGTLMRGTFTPSGSGLTTAAHMGEEPVPVTARSSNGGGDPGIPDYAKEGRGLAVKFYLPDGSKTDIVALSLPCFFVRTPEDFLEFTRLRKPDPETGQPDFEKLGEWMGRHPEAGPAIQAALTADPPESYATVAYNSIHSFRWTVPGAGCATASSPRRGSGRCRRRTLVRGGATTCRRRSSTGLRPPSACLLSWRTTAMRCMTRRLRGRRTVSASRSAGWNSRDLRPSASRATTSSSSTRPASPTASP